VVWDRGVASFFGYGWRRRAGERRLGRLTVPGRPARARPVTPETAFGLTPETATGLTLTGAAELPGPLSIARLAQQAVLTCVLLCCRSMEPVSEICAGWRILRGRFSTEMGCFPAQGAAPRRAAGLGRAGTDPGLRTGTMKWRGVTIEWGKGPAFGRWWRPAGARAVCGCWGELAGELAGLGSAWLPAAGRWLKTRGLGC